jgi:hypothetical protein
MQTSLFVSDLQQYLKIKLSIFLNLFLVTVVIFDGEQTWGQLLSNVIDYITITLQFS